MEVKMMGEGKDNRDFQTPTSEHRADETFSNWTKTSGELLQLPTL